MIMAALLGDDDFDRVPIPRCSDCGDLLQLVVHAGPSGLFVSSICNACSFIRTPYRGPGAEQAIREFALGERRRS